MGQNGRAKATRMRGRITAFVVIFALAAATAASAQQSGDGVFNTNADGVVLHGYDPVSYQTEGGPVEGEPSITTEWGGATWRFASEANRSRFLEDPERYAPAFGGYCAFAVSRGGVADIDPMAYVVHDGRLYVNLSSFFNLRFRSGIEGNIERAESNWPGIRAGLR